MQASLFTACLAMPVVGTVNICFGWLRRPLTTDAIVKSGEQLTKIKKDEETHSAKRSSLARRCKKRIAAVPDHCMKCTQVQVFCIKRACKKRSADLLHEEVSTPQEGSPSTKN